MTEQESQEGEPVLIGGLSLADWGARWEFVPDGFMLPQPKLRQQIGLFAARNGADFMYIGKAAGMRGDGLSGGLSRAYVKNASGDKGLGLRMLREHRKELQAWIIKVPRTADNVKVMEQLKTALIKLHNPVWNQSEKIIKAAREAVYEKGASRS